MHTAIELPGTLFQRAEAECVARGCSLSAPYTIALEHFLDAAARPRSFGILPGIAPHDDALFVSITDSELAEWGIG
jgi:hypothetical protein